jgi:hypothetical protein
MIYYNIRKIQNSEDLWNRLSIDCLEYNVLNNLHRVYQKNELLKSTIQFYYMVTFVFERNEIRMQ